MDEGEQPTIPVKATQSPAAATSFSAIPDRRRLIDERYQGLAAVPAEVE